MRIQLRVYGHSVPCEEHRLRLPYLRREHRLGRINGCRGCERLLERKELVKALRAAGRRVDPGASRSVLELELALVQESPECRTMADELWTLLREVKSTKEVFDQTLQELSEDRLLD